MSSRTFLRLGTGVSMGALFLTNAYALEQKKTIKVSELPLYGEPQTRVEYVEEKITAYRKHISFARQTVWNYYDSIKETRDAVSTTWDKAYTSVKDVLVFLREDNATVPRIVFISISGLGGIIAGYRGGILRKVFYASIGMSAAAALCYPEQASQLTQKEWHFIQTEAKKLLGDQFGKKDELSSSKIETPPSVVSSEDESTTAKEAENKSEQVEAVRAPGDQSVKSDRELLTTRSSV